jgi:hypothetical protein
MSINSLMNRRGMRLASALGVRAPKKISGSVILAENVVRCALRLGCGENHNRHPGGYPITQTGYLPNIYFIRKDEGGRTVRKLHQIHMAIKIEDLAHNDRHLLKPAAARTNSNRPA